MSFYGETSGGMLFTQAMIVWSNLEYHFDTEHQETDGENRGKANDLSNAGRYKFCGTFLFS